jgi:hypothetical protein
MPTVLLLRLTAGWPLEPGTRQLHGLACALFEGNGGGPDQGGIDHLGPLKPFAVWPLQATADGREKGLVLRASWLAVGQAPSAVVAPGELRLGHVRCVVAEATHRSVTHAQLAASPAADRARLTFHSPTYFSQNGSEVVLPDPRLILGSWRRQWNAWAPDDDTLKIDDDAWRELHRAVRITEFELRTNGRDTGRGRDRLGFTGTAALCLSREVTPAARARFCALARFAEFCGTGAQTTHGFGATTAALAPR